MNTTTCRSCGAEILWAATEKGRRIPLDAKPEKRFVTAPCDPDAAGASELHVRVEDTYVSHFATCPHADQHRRKS
jgi:hypothetical protein